MKVFILTEGGKNIGFGHITRCISLYQAFEEKGIRPKLIINGDNNIRSLLKGKRYQKINWVKDKNKLFRLVDNSDIVIVDSYLADFSIYKHLSKRVKTPVYIDDNKRINYPRGIVINGSVFAKDLNYPKKTGVIYLLGTDYIPLRKEFWCVSAKHIRENIERAMVSFGGMDLKNMTAKILKLLVKNYPHFIKNVMMGQGFLNKKGIEMIADNKTNLIYQPNGERVKKIMLESDIAISAGGQTTYELAKVGVPTIAIAVSENQLNNVKGWEKAGFIEYAGWFENMNISANIKRSIEVLSNKNQRMNRNEIGKSLVDGKGAKRIVETLINKLR